MRIIWKFFEWANTSSGRINSRRTELPISWTPIYYVMHRFFFLLSCECSRFSYLPMKWLCNCYCTGQIWAHFVAIYASATTLRWPLFWINAKFFAFTTYSNDSTLVCWSFAAHPRLLLFFAHMTTPLLSWNVTFDSFVVRSVLRL